MYEIFNCRDKVSVNTHALKNPKLLKEALIYLDLKAFVLIFNIKKLACQLMKYSQSPQTDII